MEPPKLSGSQSAILNINTAMKDLKTAVYDIMEGAIPDSLQSLDFAISQINSAKTKISSGAKDEH